MTSVSEENPWAESLCSAQHSASRLEEEDSEWEVDIEVDLADFRAAAEEFSMPEKATQQRATAAKRRGDKASTQAGAFVREEMHHKASGKHGRMSSKQAIAIGLSKAREAGIRVPRKARKR